MSLTLFLILSKKELELFNLNTIDQLSQFVGLKDQIEVRLPCSRPLSGIPILAIFQNLKCSNNKMTPKNKHTIKTFNLLFPYKSFVFSYGTFRVSYRHFWDILCVQQDRVNQFSMGNSIVDCIVLFWLNSGNKIEIKLNWKLNTWDMIRKIDFYKNNKRRIEWKDCYLK